MPSVSAESVVVHQCVGFGSRFPRTPVMAATTEQNQIMPDLMVWHDSLLTLCNALSKVEVLPDIPSGTPPQR